MPIPEQIYSLELYTALTRKFSHRVVLFGSDCSILSSDSHNHPEHTPDIHSHSTDHTGHTKYTPLYSYRPARVTTIAGPLCFSGDVIITDAILPESHPGDRCIVLDGGANTLSLFSRHCSRLAPLVYGFHMHGNEIHVACLKEQETESELLTFWG